MAIQKTTSKILKELKLPFTCIINSTMDLFKNPATLGIFVYLQSKPETWVIQEKELMERFGKGRDFIRDRLKELRDAGLLVAKSHKNEKGRFSGWTVTLYSHTEAQIEKKENKEKPSQKSEKDKGQEPKKNIAKTVEPDGHCAEKPRALKNQQHIKEIKTSLKKKETTTTNEVVSVSETIDKELIELRNECMPNDEREIDEFVSQCKWHIESGDKTKYTFYQRVAGLKKLIRLKRFETPATYPKKKKTAAISDDVILSNYKNYLNSWVERDLRAKGYQSMTFEEWKKRA